MSDFPFDLVGADLDARMATFDSESVIVLPTLKRKGKLLYSELDAYAVRDARRDGLRVEYLRPASDLTFHHEFAADWFLELAVALPVDLTVESIKLVARYAWSRMRGAVIAGLSPDAAETPVKIHIGELDRRANGDIAMRGVSIEGIGDGAITSLLALRVPEDQVLDALVEIKKTEG